MSTDPRVTIFIRHDSQKAKNTKTQRNVLRIVRQSWAARYLSSTNRISHPVSGQSIDD